jgi:hypothetical protein
MDFNVRGDLGMEGDVSMEGEMRDERKGVALYRLWLTHQGLQHTFGSGKFCFCVA